jgi:ABC-type nitrate/sulfonate/bicarbonate transport system substrate-binding protein
MRLTVSDVVSPSYFVATAAAELGYFRDEGVAMEFVSPPPSDASQALRDGEIDFYGCSPYVGLMAFPGWNGGRILCALSQHTYWFLAVRSDLGAKRGDVNAVKGLRISAGPQPGMALKRVLEAAGLDLARDNIRIVPPPRSLDHNLARNGAKAIAEGSADGFWGNGMRAEYAVRHGLATVLLDIRRGDGPPAARNYTFPALVTSERVLRDDPQASAGAVRAIVRTLRELRADPALATRAAQRLFPAEEAGLIAELMARDAPFFDASVSEEAVAHTVQFAQDLGLLSGPVAYEQVVATQLRPLWTPQG